MRPGPVISRGARLASAAIVLVALGVLVSAGLGHARPRAYALRAPNLYFVTKLEPGHRLCEGPVTSPTPFRTVAIYGIAARPSATLSLSVRSPDGSRVLTSGQTVAYPVPDEQRAQMSEQVPGGMPVRICVTDAREPFAVSGSQTANGDPHVVMTGATPRQEFSLLLLGRGRSFFSALPTIFSRAAVFRPSWVGAWTFWVLGAGLLGAFVLALVTVGNALESDANDDSEHAEERRRAGPAPRDGTDPA